MTFIALCGDTAPHFTTMAHLESTLGDDIARVFAAVVAICDAQGLRGRDMFAIDGVKLPSNALKHRSGTRADFERQAAKREATAQTMLARHRAGVRKPVLPQRVRSLHPPRPMQSRRAVEARLPRPQYREARPSRVRGVGGSRQRCCAASNARRRQAPSTESPRSRQPIPIGTRVFLQPQRTALKLRPPSPARGAPRPSTNLRSAAPCLHA